jgi:hypothetical protein
MVEEWRPVSEQSPDASRSARASRPDGPGKFHVGLTMAGAVSAGAYSAGVFDFLIEALSEWEKAKATGNPRVAQHEVFISVISGASAGGITGALGLLSLSGGVRPGEERPTQLPGDMGPLPGIRRVLPELYDAWVKGPRLYGDGKDAEGTFLSTRDLNSPSFISLLDSSVLSQIAENAVNNVRPVDPGYRFITYPVHLFLTLTNLDGVPYAIPFAGGQHYMVSHADRVHYSISGVGSRPFPERECSWLSQWGDTGVPLDFSRPFAKNSDDRSGFVEAVLGTSAFPVGLRPRQLSMRAADYGQRAWPVEKEGGKKNPIVPHKDWIGEETADNAPFHFVTVDGGATDNQPFELARWTIRNLMESRNNQGPLEADRAVIMVDPFGEPAPIDTRRVREKSRDRDLGLAFVLRRVVPALLNQARFKMTDLLQASDPDVYSRFLITPSRSLKGERQRPALASDALSAFGGFIDQRFREHDFQLGRRNCQKFLRDQFVLHKSNPVFGPEYRADGVDERFRKDPAGAQRGPLDETDAGDVEAFRPIIPLYGSADMDCPRPVWPELEEERITQIEKAVAARIDAATVKLIKRNVPGLGYKWIAGFIWRRFGRDRLVAQVRQTIESELYWSKQVRWSKDQVRRAATRSALKDEKLGLAAKTGLDAKDHVVLAALADPRFEFRTVDGILRQYERELRLRRSTETITREDIELRLNATLARQVVKAPRRPGYRQAYALRHRHPELARWFYRLLVGPQRYGPYDDGWPERRVTVADAEGVQRDMRRR